MNRHTGLIAAIILEYDRVLFSPAGYPLACLRDMPETRAMAVAECAEVAIALASGRGLVAGYHRLGSVARQVVDQAMQRWTDPHRLVVAEVTS